MRDVQNQSAIVPCPAGQAGSVGVGCRSEQARNAATVRRLIETPDGWPKRHIVGRYGLEGCRLLKAQGGFVFAQSQQKCVVYGMPKSVIVAGLADRILPLGRIAPGIVRHVKNSRRSPGSVF